MINRAQYKMILDAVFDHRSNKRPQNVGLEVIGDDTWYVLGTWAICEPEKARLFHTDAFYGCTILKDFLRGEATAQKLTASSEYTEIPRSKKKIVLHKFLTEDQQEVWVEASIVKVFPPEHYSYKIGTERPKIHRNIIFCYSLPDHLDGIMLPFYVP